MPRIFGTSIPKSGTHLFEAIFQDLGYWTESCPKVAGAVAPRKKMPDAAGDLYAFGHWRAQPPMVDWLSKNDFRILVMLRDPRDICISMAEFIKIGRPALLKNSEPDLMRKPLREILIQIIVGHRYPSYFMPGAKKLCHGWLDWTDYGAASIRYESVACGGADYQDIARLGVDEKAFADAAVRCFGRNSSTAEDTLNVGRAGRWRTVFDHELIDVWNRAAYGVATSWGYVECD